MANTGKKPKTDTVRLPVELIKKLRYLATHADESMPDFLSRILNPITETMLHEMVEELSKRDAAARKVKRNGH